MSTIDSTRIGDITAEYDGQTLTLLPAEGGLAINLRLSQVHELMEFLGSFNPADLKRRQSFRVPVFDPRALAVQVGIAGRLHEATAINISVSGILVSFADPEVQPLVDEPVEVRLATAGQSLSLSGIVRSARTQFFGIQFPTVLRNGQFEPPKGLTEIVMQLQRKWLARRAERIAF